MLTNKQRKLLKRAVIYSTCVRTQAIIAFALPFLWMFLIFIDNVVLDGQDFFTFGFWLMPVLELIDLAFLLVQGLYIRFAVRSKEWNDIVEKANITLQEPKTDELLIKAVSAGVLSAALANDNVGAEFRMDATVRLFKEMQAIRHMAMKMCVIFRERIPNRIHYVLAIVLIPTLVLTGTYVYRYIDILTTNSYDSKIAAASVYQAKEALEQGCQKVYIDDPLKDFDSNGYEVSGYLYENDTISNDSYIMIKIDNEGIITDVDYIFGVDVNDTKEANLERIQVELDKLHEMLMDSDLDAKTDYLTEKPYFPEETIEDFMNHSYYERMTSRFKGYFQVGYITSEKAEHDSNDDSYFYFMMGS